MSAQTTTCFTSLVQSCCRSQKGWSCGTLAWQVLAHCRAEVRAPQGRQHRATAGAVVVQWALQSAAPTSKSAWMLVGIFAAACRDGCWVLLSTCCSRTCQLCFAQVLLILLLQAGCSSVHLLTGHRVMLLLHVRVECVAQPVHRLQIALGDGCALVCVLFALCEAVSRWCSVGRNLGVETLCGRKFGKALWQLCQDPLLSCSGT